MKIKRHQSSLGEKLEKVVYLLVVKCFMNQIQPLINKGFTGYSIE